MTSYRSAMVTGASSGIGAEIARVLADRGASLTLVARRRDRLDALAAELGGRVPVEVVVADLTRDDDVDRVARRLSQQPVELLVNNAGVGTGGNFHELPVDAEVAEVRLNVLALLRLTHAALPAMVAAGRGGVLNVSSIAGNQPLPGFATYGATKAFVTSFTESVAFELRGTGVNVTVVKPGYTDTEMNADSVPSASSVQRRVLWLDADHVARAAVDAVESGRLHCVPGVTWKVADAVIQSLPRRVVRTISSRVRAT
jgi:short-subunit dehydrogenase